MKKITKNIKKIINNNKPIMLVLVLSILVFIVGIIKVGLLKSLAIIGIFDLFIVLYLYFFGSKQTSKVKNKQTSKPEKKTSDKVKKKTKKKRKIFKILGIIFIIMVIAVIAAVIAFFSIIVKEAPEFKPENLYKKESTILYYPNGEILAKLGAQKRENITYDELPEVLIDAIVATEDSRFFQHNGFDLPRFLKASFGQALGKNSGGASTLTMQVVKNNYTSKVSHGWEGIKRKFTDIYMAIFKVEKKYSKEEIIEFYVNSNFLGANAYGVEEACLTYFGKSAKDINLSEAALIAGLFQSPTSYNPFKNPEAAEKRRQVVLKLMERHGYIDSEERKIASSMSVEKLLSKEGNNTDADEFQGFIDTVAEQVKEETGNDPYVIPMEVYTTINKEKQTYINKVMDGEVFKWENETVTAGISVIDVNTGAIVAIGTGREKGARLFNNALDSKNQIGSTAKPIYDYGPGIEYNNWSTYTPFVDEVHDYSDGTKLKNFDDSFGGYMTLRTALSNSRNIPALKAFQQAGQKNIRTFATNLGLSPELGDNGFIHEAHAIGGYNGESPVKMAAAYAAFANGGYYTKPYSFTKIIYRDTKEVYEPNRERTKAMSPETAYMITDVLKTTSKIALGRYYNVNGYEYCAKTGTTNFDAATKKARNLPSGAINDLWVTGYNSDYAISVWYGYQTPDKDNVTIYGSSQHRLLFSTVAKGIFDRNSNFTKPDGVIEVTVENETYPAKLPSEFTPNDKKVTELFKVGTEPTEVSDRYSQLNNPSNLRSSVNNDTVTLTWKGIDIPNAINEAYIRQDLSQLYSTSLESGIANRISYNNSYIGNLGYQVYHKNNDGSLNLLGFTTDTKYDIKVNASTGKSATYVVKSCYSIFKDNMSSGIEITVPLNNITTTDNNNNNNNNNNQKETVKVELNGDKTIELLIGEVYIDPSVKVLDDDKDVTSKATIKTIIKSLSTKKQVTKIDTSKVDSYEITYEVTYEKAKYTAKDKRTVKVIEQN